MKKLRFGSFLIVLMLAAAGCQRWNYPYGGHTDEEKEAQYTVQLDANKPVSNP